LKIHGSASRASTRWIVNGERSKRNYLTSDILSRLYLLWLAHRKYDPICSLSGRRGAGVVMDLWQGFS
jgi:hypothetical protein